MILGQEDPLEAGRQPTPGFLPGESHGQRSLVATVQGGHIQLDTTKATEQSYMFKMNVPLSWHFDGLLTSFLPGPLFYNSLPPGIYDSIQDGLRRHLPGHLHQTLC